MVRKYIIAAYILFFFITSVVFNILATINAGQTLRFKDFVDPISISTLVGSLLVMLLAHYYVFKKYYSVKPRWKLLAAIAALLIFHILFRYWVEEVAFRKFLGYGNYNDKTSFRYYILDNIYYGSIKIAWGFVFFLLEETLLNKQRQAKLQQEKRQAELGFLKAQMNPHFLFNALNNIYSLAYEQHPQTANAVLKLSEMMRYVTYEDREYSTLQKEMEYVQHMLDLQQLRCDYPLQYRIQVAEAVKDQKLMPLLLIPMIENALKHGDLSDPKYPMELMAFKEGDGLTLCVRNKIAQQTLVTHGGIGIKNLNRRLELFYPKGQYTFEVATKDDIFTVMIKLM